MIYNTLEDYALRRLEKLEAKNDYLNEKVNEKEVALQMKEKQYQNCRKEQLRLLEEKETLIAILRDKIKEDQCSLTFELLFKHKNPDEISFILEYFELGEKEDE